MVSILVTIVKYSILLWVVPILTVDPAAFPSRIIFLSRIVREEFPDLRRYEDIDDRRSYLYNLSSSAQLIMAWTIFEPMPSAI